MAGLLGDSFDDPKTQAVFQLAAGLLGGGNFGQALGRGLGGYQETMGAAKKQALLDEQMGWKRDEINREKASQQAMQEMIGRLDPRLQGMNGPTVDFKPREVDPFTSSLYELAKADPSKYGQSYIAALKPKEPELRTVGNNLLRISGNKAEEIYSADANDPNRPFMRVNGQVVPNAAYQQFELEKAQRGAARTNVSTVVDAAPKAFWQDFAKNASDTLFKEREGAQAAAGTLQSVAEIRKAAEGGAFQGAGAELKLGAAKALQGLGMPYDAKTVANSELFNAQANQFVLNSIKGLGANPSNADREFIEKTVPRLSTDPAALPQLLNFMENKARSQLTGYNAKVKKVQSQPGGQSIPMSLEIPEPEMAPAKPSPSAMPSLPTANSGNKGRMILDQQTGQRLRSNGIQWVPEQ
jgi:hypothetical protein